MILYEDWSFNDLGYSTFDTSYQELSLATLKVEVFTESVWILGTYGIGA